MTDSLRICGKRNATSLFSRKRTAVDRYTGKKQHRRGDYERELLENCDDDENPSPEQIPPPSPKKAKLEASAADKVGLRVLFFLFT